MINTTPPPDPGPSSPNSPPNSPRAFLRRAAQALEQSPLKDVQRNVRALAHSAAGRLDLVTRDEFDALQAMLAAASQRVAQLEAQVAALESRLASGPATQPMAATPRSEPTATAPIQAASQAASQATSQAAPPGSGGSGGN